MMLIKKEAAKFHGNGTSGKNKTNYQYPTTDRANVKPLQSPADVAAIFLTCEAAK
jgi:hypothetical protein